MPFVSYNGAEIHWTKIGDGPPLILAAGLGGAASYWTPNLEFLSRYFTVYTFDQRGTGRSTRLQVESIEQLSADLIAVMDSAELKSAHFLGHSLGAAIGVATALDYPHRLKSMMLYATTTHGDAYRKKVLSLRRRIFEEIDATAYAEFTSLLLYPAYWINNNIDRIKEIEDASKSALGSVEVQSSRLNAILNFDRRHELSGLSVPVMILCAKDDILTPPYFSEEYLSLLKEAEMMWVEKGGHALSQTEPEIFHKAVLEFFNRVS